MSDNTAPRHAIVTMVSLAASIASNHPKKNLCHLERLRGYGIAQEQIDLVVDISHHIRDEAGHTPNAAAPAACCPPTAKSNSCC